MLKYFLCGIYEDNTTRCGTYANRVFKGKDINRVVRNFKNIWNGHVYRGQRIISVEVTKCNGYQEISKENIYF